MQAMMTPVHRFAVYEIAEEAPAQATPTPATPTPIESRTPTAIQPEGALSPVTGGELVKLLNHLSGLSTLGPIIVLAEGVIVIGELTGFAQVSLDQAIIPAHLVGGAGVGRRG